ncbi:CTLH/CRA C-terminal to lish motif domain-containing protein [Blastocladiella britannica]|nr:CTLH/CRA C-terminal to lish motif domain-containing protein [Blastocladiella britannica]
MSQAATNAPSGPKPVISLAEWQLRLDAARVPRADLTKLVLNYLVIEGYKDAAEALCSETGIKPAAHLAAIDGRMNVRSAILAGNIMRAIDLVNDLDPEILESDAQLLFRLHLQHLVEMIRAGDVVAAVQFAREELAPRGEDNPALLEELEQAMTLLVFGSEPESPVAELWDVAYRQQVASEVNAAILTSQSQEKDPKLPMLLRTMDWLQDSLSEIAIFPKIMDVASGSFVVPPECEAADPSAMQF